MGKPVLVFAGTSEGKQVCKKLLELGIEVHAAVATEYGENLISQLSGIRVLSGRMNKDEIERISPDYSYIVDATHPFAEEVTKNIISAKGSTPYVRTLRGTTKIPDGVKAEYFANLVDAVEYLEGQYGNILATTGSKELSPFSRLQKSRLFVRVLPMVESIEACNKCEIPPSNIIAMQGPFDVEMNVALINSTKSRFLITKDTGNAGGFPEKVEAAKRTDCTLIVINRPTVETGFDVIHTVEHIKNALGIECGDDTSIPCGEIHFPLFVNLKGRRILIVGGGKVAYRRAKTLVPFGCEIMIVAKEVDERIKSLDVTVHEREFCVIDIENKHFVIAATDDGQLNANIARISREKSACVNRADDRTDCDFFFPAIVEGENIVGGMVSKDGSKHSLVSFVSRKVRDAINQAEKDFAKEVER